MRKGGKSSGGKVGRSAITGRYISVKDARNHPDTTILTPDPSKPKKPIRPGVYVAPLFGQD